MISITSPSDWCDQPWGPQDDDDDDDDDDDETSISSVLSTMEVVVLPPFWSNMLVNPYNENKMVKLVNPPTNLTRFDFPQSWASLKSKITPTLDLFIYTTC